MNSPFWMGDCWTVFKPLQQRADDGAVSLVSWRNSAVANEEQLEQILQSVTLTTQPKTPQMVPALLLCPVSEVSQ